MTPPLEFAYIAAGLQGHAQVEVVDGYAARLSEEHLAEIAAAVDPTAVVVTSAPSLLYWRCPPLSVTAPRRAISAVRAVSQAPVILIGPHGTASPSWALERTGADWCYRGAFEKELPRILLCGDYGASAHLAPAARHWSRVSVLTARDLPQGSFDWLDPGAGYEPHMWSVAKEDRAAVADIRYGVTLEASRGCPWSCVYCAKGPVRDKFDRRPVDVLESELDQVARLGADYVFFIDETFNLPGAEFNQLLSLLQRKGLRFGFQGRPDLIDDAIAAQLGDAGCIYAELGIDTVSDALSAGIGRRQVLERACEGVRACQESIPIVRFNRLNLQTVDYQELLGEADDDWEYPADPAFPYPGAKLGEMLMKKYGREQFDWDFALRYSWWLRLEVGLQRQWLDLPRADVQTLQRIFLSLPDETASALVTALQPQVRTPPDFYSLNKIIMRKGHGVRTRSTRA